MSNFYCHIRANVTSVLLDQIAPFSRTGTGVEDPIGLSFPLAIFRGHIQEEPRVFNARECALLHESQIVILNENHITTPMLSSGQGHLSHAGFNRLINGPNSIFGLDHHIGISPSNLSTTVINKAAIRYLETHPRIAKGILGHSIRRGNIGTQNDI